jgi:hypothetical protein
LQVPETQLVVPFGFEHAVPQAPQLLALLLVFVSQPLFGLPSQLEKPPAQIGAQVPDTQLVVPLVLVHLVPHEPQLLTFALVLVSQPLFGLPSQSAVPAVQIGAHAPATQLVVPLTFVHCTPQTPQLLRLVSRLVSQPLTAFASQLAQPDTQIGAQLPPTQLVVPLLLTHCVPQLPQLAVLV